MPGINWDTFAIGNTAVKGSDILFDIMFSHSLTQLVIEPTRIHGSACSVLDLAFVSGSLTPQISIEEGISDHKLILLTFHGMGGCVSHATTRISLKDYYRANDESVTDFLKTSLDDFFNASLRVVDLWNKLKSGITHCESTFIPTKLKKTKRKTPWITRNIIHLKRKVQRLRKHKKKSAALNELSRHLKTEIKMARDHFFSSTLSL